MAQLDKQPQTVHIVRVYDPKVGDGVSVIVTGAESSREAASLVSAWAVRTGHPEWTIHGVTITDGMTLDTGTAHHVEGCTCAECGAPIPGGRLCGVCREAEEAAHDTVEH